MPRVPTYDGPQLATRALQPVYQRDLDVSSGTRALAQAADSLGGVMQQKVERDAQTEAWNAQAEINNDFVQWQAEARKNRQGANAKGFSDDVAAWWGKAKDERFSKLSPLAQQAIGKSLSTARLAALESASSYENQQLDIGERTALASSVSSLVNQAITVGPDKAGPVLEQAVKLQREWGAKKGIDVEPQVKQTLTGAHASMISSLAQTDPKAASAYFAAHKDQIDAERWDDIENSLHNADERSRVQRARTMYGDLRLGLLQGTPPTKAQVETLRQIDSEAAANLQAAINAERKAAAAEARGEKVKTDFAAWSDARTRIIAGQPVDLLTYRDRVSTEDLKSLAALQTAPEKTVEAKFDTDDFNHIADQLGLDPYNAKGEDKKRALGELKYRTEQLIDVAQRTKGKALTREEKGALMRNEMTRTVTVDPGWLRPTRAVPVIQLQPEDVERVVVPPTDKAQIAEALRTMYARDPKNPLYAPTESNVRRLYLANRSRAAALIPEPKK